MYQKNYKLSDKEFTQQSFICEVCKAFFNNARGLSVHVKKMHKIEPVDYYDSQNPDKLRTCQCGRNLKFIDQARGREEFCGKCRFKQFMRQRKVWNTGLTKASDTRMKKASEKMKNHYKTYGSSRKGRTKENDVRVAATAKKISARLKAFYEVNPHWSAGLTNETSDSISKRSINAGLTRKGKSASQDLWLLKFKI